MSRHAATLRRAAAATLAALCVAQFTASNSPLPPRPSGFFTTVALSADATFGAVIGAVNNANMSLWTSSNSGNSWTFNSGIGSRAFTALALSADGRTIAAGTGGSAVAVWVSRDAGSAWTASTFGPTGTGITFACVASSANGTMLVASLNFGQVCVSYDGGATWVPRAPAITSCLSVAMSADGRTVALATGSSLYVSYNRGATFAVSAGAAPSPIGDGISADGLTLVAVPITQGTAMNTLTVSTDGGSTWATRTVNMTDPVSGSVGWWPRSVAVSADGSRIAIAVIGVWGVYVSTDGGATFVLRVAPSWMISAAISSDGYRVLAVSGGGGGVAASSDGGITWNSNGPVPTSLATGSKPSRSSRRPPTTSSCWT